MLKRLFLFTLLFSTLWVSTFYILGSASNNQTGKGSHQLSNYAAVSNVIFVPDNYAKVQWAIGNASEGDTIIVKAGTYHENLIINKSISLVGEGADKTIIDGQGKGTIIYINSSKVSISGFTIQNGLAGIWLSNANNNAVEQNTVKNISYGIKSDDSKNLEITENTIEDTKWFSIVLTKSGNSTLRNNHLSGTRYHMRIDGSSLEDFLNDIDTSNTVNGMPVYYLKNQQNRVIDSSVLPSVGYLAFVNSTNINIRNLNVMYNGQGILLAFTNNSIIEKLSATGNWNGIEIQRSSNITVRESKTNNNGDFGIKFEHSTTSVVTDNQANNNGWAGIGVFTSTNFTVTKNVANNNIYGIDLVYSKGNTVTLNSASNPTAPSYGSIAIYYSNSNLIYHNNFANHLIFKDKNNYFKNNTWDNNFEGNHWGDYNGKDADRDGIGDTPQLLAEGNKDNYPLMGTFYFFQATPQDNITIISNSQISNFQFDQQNKKLSFDAIGENGTQGFSRLRLPKYLIGDSYTILINGKEPATTKQLPISNDTYQYVYITYMNATAVDAGFPTIFWVISIALAIVLLISISLFFMRKKLNQNTRLGSEPQKATIETQSSHFY